MPRILAISSQVVRGGVGLSATVPALQMFGHEVWALPTILLSHRPGLGRLEKLATPPAMLADMLAALEAEGCFARLDGIMTGYFPTPESAQIAAAAIRRIKAARPGAVCLCDPVLGDGDKLYVPLPVAAAIRDELLLLADIATPNRFELQWLTGKRGEWGQTHGSDPTHEALVAAARFLGPGAVVVTSAMATDTTLTTLAVVGDQVAAYPAPRRQGVPHGTGDAFAGLLLGAWLAGDAPIPAIERSLALLDALIARSLGDETLAAAGRPPVPV